MDRVIQGVSRMIGDNLGGRAPGADQLFSVAGAGVGSGTQSMNVRHRAGGMEPYSYEGVSQAERPRQRQIGCETCSLSF